jgi:hypothetical protein
MYKCDYCNKEYSTKGILENHQKTAKFCLRIRNYSNESEKIILNNTIFKCDYCEDTFTQKITLERHYERCKYKEIRQKDEEIRQKDEKIYNLKNIIEKEEEKFNKIQKDFQKLREDVSSYRTDILIHKKELETKDEIIQELKREIESLKKENKDTYKTLIEHSDKTYNTFFEKEEKLIDTLLQQNNSSKNSKTVQHHLTINNYGIKPLTQESIINAFESFSSRSSTAFNAFQYDGITLERGNMKVEYIFYGIIRELKDYYGITDISREKVVFNNNGEMTLTTVQEFIRTNVVMNNIDAILEWISNLLSQVKQRIEDGEIEMNGEMREMTETEKNKLSDTGESLEYIYKLFKISKDKGTANNYMTKLLSEGAMQSGKVISKVKQTNLLMGIEDKNSIK